MKKELQQFVDLIEKKLMIPETDLPKFLTIIQEIEKETHQKIIEENEGIISISDGGYDFLLNAKRILEILEKSITKMPKLDYYEQENYITIGMPRDSASSWGFRCIKDFNKRHPGLRISVLAHDFVSKEMREQADVIFWCYNKDVPNFEKCWNIEYKYGLYAGEKYLQKYQMPTVDTIKKHPIIAYSGKDNNLDIANWHLTGKYGLPPLVPTFRAESRRMIAKMVEEDIGIGALSDRTDIYYEYENVKRILPTIEGPILRSNFFIRNFLTEQKMCNAHFLSDLFRNYFLKNHVKVVNFMNTK